MSDESRPKPGYRLPPSGLADEVLSALDGEAAPDDPGQAQQEADPTPSAAPSAADRIYTFTDSLQLGDDEQEEREVYETWVEFDLAGDRYALPVGTVQEVLRVMELTPVPGAPHPVLGVFNLRGRVVPLVDLRARLELPAGEPDGRSRILVIDSRSRCIGLLVDSVERVFKLAMSTVEPAPADAGEAILGTSPSPAGRLRLLEVASLLSQPRARDEAGTQAPDD